MKKKAYLFLFAFLLVMLIIEILFAHPHYHEAWNVIPGADIFIGFVGAWILICLSKITLATLIQRPTDYYEGGSRKADGHKKGGTHHD
jgi:hypothetical protein